MIAEPERRAHSARRPPRRPLSKVRQPQILATTVELLREQGLWSVRVSDVAETSALFEPIASGVKSVVNNIEVKP